MEAELKEALSLAKKYEDRYFEARQVCEEMLAYLSGGECTPQVERDLREKLRAVLRMPPSTDATLSKGSS